MLFVWFSVDAVVARYKHEHIVEGLSLREPVSRVSELSLILCCSIFTENQVKCFGEKLGESTLGNS